MSEGNILEPSEVERPASGRDGGEASARRLVRRINGVKTTALRRGAIALFFDDVGAEEAAIAFDELLWRSVRGDSKARSVWLTVAQWIISCSLERSDSVLEALREAAEVADLDGLRSILRVGPARKVLPAAARMRDDAGYDAAEVVFPNAALAGVWWALPRDASPSTELMLEKPRPATDDSSFFVLLERWGGFTVGERRRFVRLCRVLETVATSARDPSLLRRFLGQSWLELKDLLMLLTRRPQSPNLVHEALLSERWGANPQVHEALVRNPFTPSDVVLPLLPIVARTVLDELAKEAVDGSVVNDTAKVLTSGRGT